jgi:hypothetical protein
MKSAESDKGFEELGAISSAGFEQTRNEPVGLQLKRFSQKCK